MNFVAKTFKVNKIIIIITSLTISIEKPGVLNTQCTCRGSDFCQSFIQEFGIPLNTKPTQFFENLVHIWVQFVF